MGIHFGAGFCIMMVLLMDHPRDSKGFDLTESVITTKLLEEVSNLWSQGSVEFLGRECYFSTSPTFYRWELYRRGKFWCPGFAPFSGTSKKYSQSGAIEHATRDFVHKAIANDLIDEDEAKIWLNSK